MAKRKDVNVAEESTELSEQSRREFITKMVTAAGAVAAAGLVAGAQSAGAVEDHKIESSAINMGKVELHKDYTQIKLGKIRNGFRLSMSGRELGTSLQQVGVLGPNANLDNATITIEFSA